MTMQRKHRLVFTALWAISLLVWWRPLVNTFSISVDNNEYTYLLLIFPISATFLFLERRSWWDASEWSFRLAPIVLGAGAVLAMYARYWAIASSGDVQLALEMSSLVLLWIGIFALCFGAVASESALFSLVFLFGLVPLPENVLNFIIALLQEGSAWSAHALFTLFAVPVVQQGNFLTIPGLTIQVAQECSSIRSSSMLFVTTIVLVQVLLRSPWRKAMIVGFAVPLSVAKNGLRIFTIAMLGTRVDPGYLTGRLHHQGGILFFAIAIAGIFALLAVCRRGEEAALEASRVPLGLNAN